MDGDIETIDRLTGELVAMADAERARRGMTPALPLGLHFGLAEDRYHQDPGIGSSQIRQLTRNPQVYWYGSWMNQRRPTDEPTPSQRRGTALHHLVYLGEDYFAERYMCGPDQYGMSTGEKASSTKRANALAEQLGKVCLKIDDYERVCICAAMITRNPELAGVFVGGRPEVSLFWERDGVRCKARFDYVKHRAFDNVAGIGDLKSEANPFELNFPQACRNAIGRYAYDEQASWYMDAAAYWIPRFVSSGAVYGSDYDGDWLERLAGAGSWAWQWVWYGIEGPPLTWSAILSPENPMVKRARGANAAGLANYKRFLAHYGVEQWLLVERPQELVFEEMPGWFGR